MSNKEILEKAIQKAIDGGWKDYSEPPVFPIVAVTDKGRVFFDSIRNEWHVWQIIFNHDFAKALWSEHEYKAAEYHKKRSIFRHPITHEESEFNEDYIAYDLTPRGYKYHLQQMVIAEDPIAYLGANI